MVTLAGQQILAGKQRSDGGVSPKDWVEFTVATLCHDIGYVRGVCRDDGDGVFVVDAKGKTVELGEEATDAMLTPHHVERGKIFVRERFGNNSLIDISADVMARYIEKTKFPPPKAEQGKDSYSELGDLVRAADLIGQLGDPGYLRKVPALFHEFEQLGTNEKLGYANPGIMRNNYAKFYWDLVYPYIRDAISYLETTENGRQWVSNLYAHVFRVEHGAI